MFMSLSCTVLGVGLFIVTQATTSGFEQFFTNKILGINGAILGAAAPAVREAEVVR